MPQFRRVRRGFRSFGRRSSRTVPRWTAQTVDVTLSAAAPAVSQILYVPGTTIGAGQYEEETKLLRIVGRLGVHTLAATAAAGPVGLGILKTDVANLVVGGFQDPLVATELASKDWLGVYNVAVPPNAGANAWHRYQEVDIRVQRRLKANEGLYVQAVQGLGVDSVVITIDVRILIVIRL